MRRPPSALVLFGCTALAVALALGCTHKVHLPVQPETPQTFLTPDSVQTIFTNNCISCHAGEFAQAGMDLTVDSSYVNVVRVESIKCSPLSRIEPFQPDNSCLVLRIEGAVTPRMPLFGNSLSPAEINTIRNWVLAGAPGTPVPVLAVRR